MRRAAAAASPSGCVDTYLGAGIEGNLKGGRCFNVCQQPRGLRADKAVRARCSWALGDKLPAGHHFQHVPQLLPNCALAVPQHNLSSVDDFVAEQVRRLRQIQAWRGGRARAVTAASPLVALLSLVRSLAADEARRYEEVTGRDCIPWWHAHGPSFEYAAAPCCGRREAHRTAAMARRPRRPDAEPYLFNIWGLGCDDASCSHRASDGLPSLFPRRDVLWVSVDLNDHIYHDDTVPLPGVAIPPPKFYLGPPWRGEPGRLAISFLGSCSKTSKWDRVRVKLRALARLPTDPRIKIACIEDVAGKGGRGGKGGSGGGMFLGRTVLADGDSAYYEQIAASDFVLVPHGHARYNYRFSEAVGACAVPVVVADGLTLPFEPLIDWSGASVRVPEREWHAMRSLNELRRYLPADPAEVLAMRHRVCALNAVYLWSEAARRDALFLAASAHLFLLSFGPRGGGPAAAAAGTSYPPNWPRAAADRIWSARRMYDAVNASAAKAAKKAALARLRKTESYRAA